MLRMRYEREGARCSSAALVGALLAHFVLESGVAVQAASAVSESAAEERKRLYYTGQETRKVYGRTLIEGARGSVALEAVLQGDEVRHDLILRNDGDEPLELSDVKACTGCVLEGHTRTIPPGREGRISILLLTDSNGGTTMKGTVRARTDSPERPSIAVDVSMKVKQFAELQPYRVWLEGKPGEEIVERCRVFPSPDYPFNITDIKTRKGAWFDLSYQEITHEGRAGYEITLRNTRTRPGPYQDVLYVQTDHPERPEFKIRVEGRLSE